MEESILFAALRNMGICAPAAMETSQYLIKALDRMRNSRVQDIDEVILALEALKIYHTTKH